MNRLLISAFYISLVLNTGAYANDEAQYQKSIEKIAKEISVISRNINANKKRHGY